MKKVFPFILFSLLLTSVSSCGPAPLPEPDVPPDGKAYIDILQINDFHGKMNVDNDAKDPGIARISRYIKARRARNPDGLVLLSGGDMWQGSSASNSNKGKLVNEWMNLIEFDAMTLGNHEFDWGVDNIKEVKEEANFPFLGANIIDYESKERLDFIEPYTIIERLGFKIGVIGIIGEDQWEDIYSQYVIDLEFATPVSYVETLSTTLKEEEDCDIVVLSMHEGHSTTYINQYVSMVDVILCAHDHETYISNNQGIYVINCGVDGHHMSSIRFEVDLTTREFEVVEDETMYTPDNYLYEYDADPEVDEWFKERYDTSIDKQVIGRLEDGDLSESGSSDLSVLAIYDHVKNELGYDIVYAFDTRSQRSTIYEGDITYERLYKVMPFDNDVVILELKGSQISSLKSGNAFYRPERIAFDSEETYLVASTNFIAYRMSSSRRYTGIYDFDPTTQVVDYLEGTYPRELVKSYLEEHGSVSTRDFNNFHFSDW